MDLDSAAQELIDFVFEPRRRDLALPDREYAPTKGTEGTSGGDVARDVAGELSVPIRLVGGGKPSSEAGVLMPKAAVDEHHRSMLRQHQVWRSWKVASMEAEAVSHAVNEAPDQHLGPRVFGTDARHDGASLIGGASIHH